MPCSLPPATPPTPRLPDREETIDMLHNVATTAAEYLSVGVVKAEAGYDTRTAACEHATDIACVHDAYTACERMIEAHSCE